MAGSFADTNHWLSEYDCGRFCHSPTGGGGIRSTDFYGETCISQKYAMQTWGSLFSRIEYIEASDRKGLEQNFIVAMA